MTPFVALAAGAALGAASGFHCIAMCGPLAAATCTRKGGGVERRTLGEYLGGRAVGYTIVGGIAGAAGAPLVTGATGGVLRIVVAALVALVLVARGVAWLWPSSPLVKLRRKKPGPSLLDRFLPLLPRRGLGLGLATAVFPCGALLGGIVAAAATGAWTLGAMTMFAFALGSAPLLVVPTLVGAKIPQRLREGWGRRIAGAALIAVGAWVVAVPVLAMASQPSKPACCQHHHG